MSNQIWMIRAGQNSFLINEFLSKGIVALGWNELGSIPKGLAYEKLKDMVATAYPDYTKGRVNQSTGQMWRFLTQIEIGDVIVTYDSESR